MATTEVIIILIKNVKPPIVGVPVFFMWLCGPSSRILCPNFILFNVGISMGTSTKLLEAITSHIQKS